MTVPLRSIIIIRNDFFDHYLFCILLLHFLYLIELIFKRVVTLFVKKGFNCSPECYISVTSVVLILPKNVCFAFIIRVTQ